MSEHPSTVTPNDTAAGPRVRRMNYEPDPSAAVQDAGRVSVLVCEDIVVDPQLTRAANRLIAFMLQVIDGHRAAAQLAPLMTVSESAYLRAITTGARPSVGSRVLRVRVTQPGAAAGEVAAVVQVDDRARAVAARFERDAQGWCCTVLRVLSPRRAAAAADPTATGTTGRARRS